MRILGIDAGGSKTRVVAVEQEDLEGSLGNVFDQDVLEPCNYRQDGSPGVRELVEKIKKRFRIHEPGRFRVVGGFAGAGAGEDCTAIGRVFEREGFGKKSVFVTSDAALVLMALGNDGIALLVGTGSICMGRNRSKSDTGKTVEVRAGGYGYLAGVEPGGFYLGVRAIDAALRIEDGRQQEPTILYDRVKNHFGIEELSRMPGRIHGAGDVRWEVRKRVAGLSPCVLRSAHEGDRVAAQFVREMVDELADHLRAVSKRLGVKRSRVGLHGGLFTDPHGMELIVDPLKRHERLEELDLEFETLGIREGDRDPLIEAIRFHLGC